MATRRRVKARYLEGVAEPKAKPDAFAMLRTARAALAPRLAGLRPAEQQRLKRVFDVLACGDDRLTAAELHASLTQDGIATRRSECRDMLWELSATGDKTGLSFNELAAGYLRAAQDATGREPRRLYTYLMYKLMELEGTGVSELQPAGHTLTKEDVYCFLAVDLPVGKVEEQVYDLFGPDSQAADSGELYPSAYVRIAQSSLLRHKARSLEQRERVRVDMPRPKASAPVRYRELCRSTSAYFHAEGGGKRKEKLGEGCKMGARSGSMIVLDEAHQAKLQKELLKNLTGAKGGGLGGLLAKTKTAAALQEQEEALVLDAPVSAASALAAEVGVSEDVLLGLQSAIRNFKPKDGANLDLLEFDQLFAKATKLCGSEPSGVASRRAWSQVAAGNPKISLSKFEDWMVHTSLPAMVAAERRRSLGTVAYERKSIIQNSFALVRAGSKQMPARSPASARPQTR